MGSEYGDYQALLVRISSIRENKHLRFPGIDSGIVTRNKIGRPGVEAKERFS